MSIRTLAESQGLHYWEVPDLKIIPVRGSDGVPDIAILLEPSDLERKQEKPTFEVGDRFKANERHPDFLIEVPEEFRENCRGEVFAIQENWHGPGGTLYSLQTPKGWFQCLNMDWAKKAVKIDEPGDTGTTA